MKSRDLYSLLLGALLLTLAALVLHGFLPERRLTLLPPQEDTHLWLYLDEAALGADAIIWVDESAPHWRCIIPEDAAYHYCGMSAAFGEDSTRGLDLSGYQRLEMEVVLSDNIRAVNLFLRNYNPAYATPEDPNSPQFVTVSLRAQDTAQPLAFDLEEFRVADWWLQDRDLPRQYTRPEFGNIVALGVDLPSGKGPGSYDIRIERLDVVGVWISAERWYLGILVLWMLAIFTATSARLIRLRRRTLRDRERIRALSSSNLQLKHQREEYRKLSTVDALTGALNRHGFAPVMERVFQERGDQPLALIVIDIDHFKRINDRRGHKVGDQVLSTIAAVILANTRQFDTLCRWGGEEFVLLCPGTDNVNAYLLAEKIRQMIFDIHFDDSSLSVTASLGVASAEPQEDFQSLFTRADAALYEAKELGRNCTIRV